MINLLTHPLTNGSPLYSQFGEDHGPATRRVIARLFKVLEATQGSAAAGGGLEYEVYT